MRLVVGGPTRDTVPVAFAVDLAALYARTVADDRWSAVTMGFVVSTYVHVGREAVVMGALFRHATHLLWLDTDMTFPPDTAIRLASHNVPVVGCNCLMKDPRELFTAEREDQRITTTPDSTGLEAVDSMGLAVVLMRTDVVADLARPWFRHGQTNEGVDIGEDRMFCRALRAAGHDILIDHDLSKEVGHIGQHTYRPGRTAALAV